MDPSYWDDILGSAKESLGTLFSDLTERHLGPSYGAPSLPDRTLTQMTNPFMLNLSRQSPMAQGSTEGGGMLGRNVFAQARQNAAAPQGPMYGGQFQYDTALEVPREAQAYVEMARQAARAQGVDEDLFIRQLWQESKFDPKAISKAGAKGLGQLMDPTARELGVTDSYDPQQNINGSARYLRQQLDRYKGDYRLALGAYTAGAGNVDSWGGELYGDAAIYANRILTGAKRKEAQQQPDAALGATPGASGGSKPLHGITPYQYGQEALATGASDYICGPIAATAFVKANGRDMTLTESLNVARQMGVIDPANGMHGIESTARLIRQLGGQATTGRPESNLIVSEILAGRPVIVDTNAGSKGHYFVIEDYDKETGRFDFGNSARALKASGGRTWFTLNELKGLGFGEVQGAIYAR